jgi:hypothetical protein
MVDISVIFAETCRMMGSTPRLAEQEATTSIERHRTHPADHIARQQVGFDRTNSVHWFASVARDTRLTPPASAPAPSGVGVSLGGD